MRKTNRLARRARSAVLVAAATVAAVVAPTAAAHAGPPHHYYVEIGGTGAALAAPDCTRTYYYANQHLEDGAVVVPVCYPASAGPWFNGQNQQDLFAQSYDSSVAEGYRNLLAAVEKTHADDPSARITVVGYSQGAQAADAVLETVAGGSAGVPRDLVDGKLYADPKQPVTGMWTTVPQGVGAFGFTSTGPGPVEFDGVPVARYCIRQDMACDATTLVSAYDFFLTDTHSKYVLDGDVMTRTIAEDRPDGVFWYDS